MVMLSIPLLVACVAESCKRLRRWSVRTERTTGAPWAYRRGRRRRHRRRQISRCRRPYAVLALLHELLAQGNKLGARPQMQCRHHMLGPLFGAKATMLSIPARGN